jgi:CRISPR-associated protein Csb2
MKQRNFSRRKRTTNRTAAAEGGAVTGLVISVRFHDGRYHGAGDWPPSPARLFQALVAGAARGTALAEEDVAALRWLEALDPPVIAAPKARCGTGFKNYVPNNDLDAVGGDLRRIGAIRTAKTIRPRLFDAAQPLLYIWRFEAEPLEAQRMIALAERLYQFGRGVDMAWAWAELVESDAIETRLAACLGVVYRPGGGEGKTVLACLQRGSLESLRRRFDAQQKRFSVVGKGEQLFSQPPKPRFRMVSYAAPWWRRLFDLRAAGDGSAEPAFAPHPLRDAPSLVAIVRDLAVQRLKRGLSGNDACIERVLIGRGATEADKTARVRIVPLPSIGHAHADQVIRRVLVEIPPNCPIAAGDIEWAFSGLPLGADPETGEIGDRSRAVLTQSADQRMLRHYGIDSVTAAASVWRTVTPAALPQSAGRRASRRKTAPERVEEETKAAAAVVQALRHAGIATRVTAVRVQREPFAGNGERVEVFARDSRFTSQRLWHVEITVAEPISGPVIIGDGRYLGLGLMRPAA